MMVWGNRMKNKYTTWCGYLCLDGSSQYGSVEFGYSICANEWRFAIKMSQLISLPLVVWCTHGLVLRGLALFMLTRLFSIRSIYNPECYYNYVWILAWSLQYRSYIRVKFKCWMFLQPELKIELFRKCF